MLPHELQTAATASGYTLRKFWLEFLFLLITMPVLAALNHVSAATASMPLRPRIRGWKKQIDDEENSRPRSRSPRRNLGAKAMLQAWAKGDISAAGMWRVAHAIVVGDKSDCGAAMHRIAHLASQRLGSEKNVQRRLEALMAETALPEIIEELPHAKGEYTITHHLPPVELIRLIHKNNRRKFAHIFGADTARLHCFWRDLFSSVDGSEFQALHPLLSDKNRHELRSSIPFIIHEDAAPYGKKQSVNLVQWGPLLKQSSDIESRFVHHAYVHKRGEMAATADVGWAKLWEQVDLMAKGVDGHGHPFAQDEDGNKWTFIFLFRLSDFDMDSEHGLPNYKRSREFCKHCRATNYRSALMNTIPHNDLTPKAKWRSELIGCNSQFMGRIGCNSRPHPMTTSKFFNRFTCRNDLMHCLDHHGVWGSVFGSTVWYLVYNDGVPTLGTTQQQRLDVINKLLTIWYQNEGFGVTSRIDKLTVNNLKPAGTAHYAGLAGPTIKAANTRQAMPFLQKLADMHLIDRDDMDHLLIHRLVHDAIGFNRTLNESGTFLTGTELQQLTTHTQGVGKYLQLLRSRAKTQKQLLWHITPKTHYMQHFPDEARLINPKAVQCYIEESTIGKVAKIWASSKSGPYRETIQRTALLKYLLWLSIEMDL